MSFINAQTANILGAVSGLVSGVGQMMGAKNETQTGDFNAQVDEQRAQAERSSAVLLEGQKRKLMKSQIGSQVASFANSGIKMTGSPIDVMIDSITNAEMDISIDNYNSEIIARGFETDARQGRIAAMQRASLKTGQSAGTFLSTAAGLITSSSPLGGKTPTLGAGYLPSTPKGVVNMGTWSKLPGK